MLIYIAIFLIIAAITVSNVVPESKGEVWRSSIIIPISFAIVASFILAVISSSTAFFTYRFGEALGGCVPSIIVSSLTIYFCLKNKLEHEDDYKYPKVLLVVIVICLLIGGLQLYLSYHNRKALVEYLNSEMNSDDNAVNNNLNEDIGDGLILRNYKVNSYKRIFTIMWAGKHKSDFDDKDITTLKYSFIIKMRNGQFPSKVQDMFDDSKEKGYDIMLVCQNENNEELFTFTILPYEL